MSEEQKRTFQLVLITVAICYDFVRLSVFSFVFFLPLYYGGWKMFNDNSAGVTWRWWWWWCDQLQRVSWMLTLGPAVTSLTNGFTTFSQRAANSSHTAAARETRTFSVQKRNASERVCVNESCNSKVSRSRNDTCTDSAGLTMVHVVHLNRSLWTRGAS